MPGIADSSITKPKSSRPSLCINCLCATTIAAETTTDEFGGSPMSFEFPDTLKNSSGTGTGLNCASPPGQRALIGDV